MLNVQFDNLNYSSCKTTKFSSRNCPVAPFSMLNGRLHIKEITAKDKQELRDALQFYNIFLGYENNKPNGVSKKEFSKVFSDIRKTLKHDKDATILVGRNSDDNVAAMFYLCRDQVCSRAAVVKACFLDNEFVHQGVGKVLLNKLLESARGHFRLCWLMSKKDSVEFYENAGFSRIEDEDLSELSRVSKNYFELKIPRMGYVPMSKPLETGASFKTDYYD